MSKTKNEHIEYWLKSSEMDFDTASYLLDGKKYVHALFFCHLTIEKICKALWIKNNEENVPPKIHNILKILNQGQIDVDNSFLELINELNKYQIEGRYQAEIFEIEKSTTKNIANNIYNETIKLKEWLLKKLQ